jgi:hypothetical protein
MPLLRVYMQAEAFMVKRRELLLNSAGASAALCA